MKRILELLAALLLVSTVFAEELPPAPRTSALAGITISTANLDDALTFYCDTLGCEEIGQGKLSASETARFWPWAPKGTKTRYAILKKGVKATLVTLVEFADNTGVPIRGPDAPTASTGIFDIAFRVRDMDAAISNFSDKGFSFLRPPCTYTAGWTKSVVKEGILVGPDGLHIAFIQKVTPPTKPPLSEAFGDITDSAQIVHSIDECADFYQGALGLSYVGDMMMSPGELDEFLNLPAGTTVRIAFFIDPKRPEYPPIEVLELYVDGKRVRGPDLAPATRSANTGALAISVATDDLSGSLARLSALQYRILSGPSKITLSGRGQIRFAYVEAPSRVVLRLEETKIPSPSK